MRIYFPMRIDADIWQSDSLVVNLGVLFATLLEKLSWGFQWSRGFVLWPNKAMNTKFCVRKFLITKIAEIAEIVNIAIMKPTREVYPLQYSFIRNNINNWGDWLFTGTNPRLRPGVGKGFSCIASISKYLGYCSMKYLGVSPAFPTTFAVFQESNIHQTNAWRKKMLMAYGE